MFKNKTKNFSFTFRQGNYLHSCLNKNMEEINIPETFASNKQHKKISHTVLHKLVRLTKKCQRKHSHSLNLLQREKNFLNVTETNSKWDLSGNNRKKKEIQILVSAVLQSYIIGKNRKKHVRKTLLKLPSQTVGRWNIIQNKTKPYSLSIYFFFLYTYIMIVSA